jgi:hypothetical protein
VLTGSTQTGYVSSSGIQQSFISGPYSGSLVTSSYSSGSILSGPTINFKQSFVSGTVDAIIPCINSTSIFYRYYNNPTICPPGGCFAPILTSATPLNCTTNWTSSYAVTYDSSSAIATKTIIEYSYNPLFSPKVSRSINNPTSTILPFSTIDDFNIFNTPNTTMYFRAYNSCSIGTTSSYSNVLTASCLTAPIDDGEYLPFTVQIKNFSGITIKYINPITSAVISVANNRSSSFNFSEETTSTQIAIQGVSDLQEPNPNGNYDHSINISSSQAVDCNVATTVSPLLENSYFTPTTVNCGYIDGGTFAFFDSDGTASTYDAQVDIDRGTYTPSGTITLSIRPSFFAYNF